MPVMTRSIFENCIPKPEKNPLCFFRLAVKSGVSFILAFDISVCVPAKKCRSKFGNENESDKRKLYGVFSEVLIPGTLARTLRETLITDEKTVVDEKAVFLIWGKNPPNVKFPKHTFRLLQGVTCRNRVLKAGFFEILSVPAKVINSFFTLNELLTAQLSLSFTCV